MIASEAAVLTVLACVVAIGALAAAVLIRHKLRRTADTLAEMDARVAQLTQRLPAMFDDRRRSLTALAVAAERGLWAVAAVDERVDELTESLIRARVASERARVQLARAEANVDRVKSGLKLALRAIELRRAFLG